MEDQSSRMSLTNNQLTAQDQEIEPDDDEDYQIVIRSPQTSVKYGLTLIGKEIHTLNKNEPSTSLKNIPIVCSYADMDFKFSSTIQKDFLQRFSVNDLHLGYAYLPKARQAIVKRLHQHTGLNFKKQELILVTSMLTLYHLVVTELTAKGDQVLILTPTYYRLLFTLRNQERIIVQYELKTKEDQNGESNLYIDFQQLEKIFSRSSIKMMVFANPHNPTGKVWSKYQMIQLKELCINDDIFCECIKNPQQQYTSFLQFPQLHDNLIWAGSFGKAFNCSSNSFTYAIVQKEQIRHKLDQKILRIYLYPTYAAGQLLESCYSVGQQWRLNTINYILRNYEFLKRQMKRKGMKICLYSLQSSFITLLDFSSYKLPHSEMKKRIQGQNVFPTFLQACYVSRSKQSISCVRFNIAMNREILKQLIDRLYKALHY